MNTLVRHLVMVSVVACAQLFLVCQVTAETQKSSDVIDIEDPMLVDDQSIVVTGSREEISAELVTSELANNTVGPKVKGAQLCPAVDCDCDALEKTEWVKKCSDVEIKIALECLDNNGTPINYCGLHGPKAFPVALTIGATPIDSVESVDAAEALVRRAPTTMWSLRSDFKSLQQFVADGRFGEAVQTQKIIDGNLDNLFSTQYSAHRGFVLFEQNEKAATVATDFAKEDAQFASELDAFSELLWASKEKLEDEQAKRAYEILSYRIARSVGKVYEHSAALYADADNKRQSAKIWQTGAEVAQRLAQWAEGASKPLDLVNAYRQQASARWQRASYYWLQVEKSDLAISAEKGYDEMAAAIRESQETLIGGDVGLTAP